MRTLIGYTLVVEVIFRWPGLGFTLVDSVLKRDYSQAQMLALLLVFAVIVVNLLGGHWSPRCGSSCARASAGYVSGTEVIEQYRDVEGRRRFRDGVNIFMGNSWLFSGAFSPWCFCL